MEHIHHFARAWARLRPRILEPDNAMVSSGNRGLPAFRHATRFSAFDCGRSPDVRQLLIPSVAIL